MKQPVNTMIGWHELLQTLTAFVNNYDGKHFAGTKADLYDAITSGTVELTNLGVTMVGQ